MSDRLARLGDWLVVGFVAAMVGGGLVVSPLGAGAEDGLWLLGHRLPPICWFRITTGLRCAGCGLTRSVALLLHGRVAESWEMHPFGAVVLLLALLQLPPRLARIAGRGERWVPRYDRAWNAATLAILLLLVGWWMARMALVAAGAPLLR